MFEVCWTERGRARGEQKLKKVFWLHQGKDTSVKVQNCTELTPQLFLHCLTSSPFLEEKNLQLQVLVRHCRTENWSPTLLLVDQLTPTVAVFSGEPQRKEHGHQWGNNAPILSLSSFKRCLIPPIIFIALLWSSSSSSGAVLPVLGTPELDAAVQVGSHDGQNAFPHPAFDGAQDTFGFLG